MLKKSFYILLYILCMPFYASAESTQLSIKTVSNLSAGHVTDGTRIGKISISNADNHCGFNVWLDAFDNKNGRYTLKGVNSNTNTLNVRLSGNGLFYPLNHKGVDFGMGGEKFSSINIVIDGNQNINSDAWRIHVIGKTNECS